MKHECVRKIASKLQRCPFKGIFSYELQVEERVGRIMKDFLMQNKKLSRAEVENNFFIHGKDKEGRSQWSRSKKLQDVFVYGCKNTGDIFFSHPKTGPIYVEVKFSKEKLLSGDIQRAVGQSVIAALRHNHGVLCFIGYNQQRKKIANDYGEELREKLWKYHRVALVIRRIHPFK